MGGESGEVVGDRLAGDVVVPVDVGERERGAGGERAQQLVVVLAERPARAADRDHAVRGFALLARPDGDRRDVCALGVSGTDAVVALLGMALGLGERGLEIGNVTDLPGNGARLGAVTARAHLAPLGAGRVDRGGERKLQQRTSIQA